MVWMSLITLTLIFLNCDNGGHQETKLHFISNKIMMLIISVMIIMPIKATMLLLLRAKS